MKIVVFVNMTSESDQAMLTWLLNDLRDEQRTCTVRDATRPGVERIVVPGDKDWNLDSTSKLFDGFTQPETLP